MQKRIRELAQGKIDKEAPIVRFPETKIERKVLEGQSVDGFFLIQSENGVPLKGFVYASGARMKCLTPRFEGEEAVIRYEFHSEGLTEGDIQKGDFTIICNQGEYNLSFVVTITGPHAQTSFGEVRSLKDFAALSKEHTKEALRVFSSGVFPKLLSKKNPKETLCYRAFVSEHPTLHDMEEFLLAVKCREQTDFSLQESTLSFYEVKASAVEYANLCVDTPGWIEIEASSEDPFLVLKKTSFTADDFIGKTLQVPFFIDASAMHAGKNFGAITFTSIHKSERLLIMATSEEKDHVGNLSKIEVQKGRVLITKLYIDYRLKKLSTGEWTAKTIDCLKHLQAIEEDNPWFALMQAQCLLVNRQTEDALWILDEFKKNAPDRTTPLYGYYLYLTTLAQREPVYVDKMTEQISVIARSYPKDPVLFWVLLFLKEEYCNENDKRLKALEERFLSGSNSPFFYMEAYYVFWSDPYQLVKLERFEIQVLFWAARQGALSKDLAIQIMTLTATKRSFDAVLYRLLCLAYECFPKEETVSTVCAYLIRCQCFSHSFFHWYEKGIALNLRVTGLNEAYVLSANWEEIQTLPKVIRGYFQYHSHISYEKKAALFANILKNKESDPELYISYRKQMELFAMEQIEAGHIDENLAKLYDELLTQGLLNRDMAGDMAELFFRHRVRVSNPNIAFVNVLHAQCKKVQRVPVADGEASISLYTTEYVLYLEDNQGKKYAASEDLLELERFLNPSNYLRRCLLLAPDKISYLLRYFDGKKNPLSFSEEDVTPLLTLLESEDITSEYRKRLLPIAVNFFHLRKEEEYVIKYLKQVDFSILGKKERCELIALFLDYKMEEYAYEMLSRFGYEQFDPNGLVSLCTLQIRKISGEEDDFLLALCRQAFRQKKYSTEIVEYLVKYCNAGTDTLTALWKSAMQLEVDTASLEERLLMQMLYTCDLSPDADDIFDSFCAHGGRDLIRQAYLNFLSHQYFVKEAVVSYRVFEQIRDRKKEGKEVSDVCRLALLKNDSDKKEFTEEELKDIERELSVFTEREWYFPFYKKFPNRLQQEFQLYDKTFVEIREDPKKRMVIHYIVGEEQKEYQAEDMVNMYGGIFVKSFVLFFGDSISYYITQETDNSSVVCESAVLANNDVYGEYHESRFDLLNAILLEQTIGDEKELMKKLSEYERQTGFVKEHFTLL